MHIKTSKGRDILSLSRSLFLVLSQPVPGTNSKVPIPHESTEGENRRSSKQSLISSLLPTELDFFCGKPTLSSQSDGIDD